jgi:hypothetical protein
MENDERVGFVKENFSFYIVDIMTKEIEEYFLDRILIDIQAIDQNKCVSIGKNQAKYHLGY